MIERTAFSFFIIGFFNAAHYWLGLPPQTHGSALSFVGIAVALNIGHSFWTYKTTAQNN